MAKTPRDSSRDLSKYYPSSRTFEIAHFPMYWIARVNARYAMEMEKKLKRVDMDVARWRVAVLVNLHGELSISQIAEHAIAKMPTVTKIVYRMQEEGLLTVKTSEADGRVSLVTITDKGRAAIAAVNQSTVKTFDRLFAGLNERQLEALMTTLRQMFANLSDG